jgi:hypothetical protein
VHDLDAEPAADVGRDDLDAVQRQLQPGRQRRPHRRRRLGGRVDAQAGVVGVPARVHALALERCGRAAFDVEVQLEDVRRGVDGGGRVAARLHHVGRDVAGDVVVHQDLRGTGRLDAHDRRQEVVGHRDPRADVLGDVPVRGDDHDDRLADVVDLVLRQRVRRTAVGERGVRDEQRQRLAGPAVEVLVRVDGDQALDADRVGDVDVDDAGVRVRAAHERRRQRLVADVVEVAALPGQQPRVLEPRDRLAERPGRHDGATSPAASARSSAARRTDATMFW